MHKQEWEIVIGIEIHTQLNTRTKLFSSAPNRFGDEPNTNITEVCTGQPGALPVLNQEAVTKSIQFGCAIGAKINPRSTFDRKSYFYPDSPRNFQITQFDNPIIIGGSVQAMVGSELRTFAIEHAHLEDDAGMLKHFTNFAGVDYNRAGAPLIEIVSMPCMHTPQEATAYAQAIKGILEYCNVSDCNMEEGQLRMDVNISVRPKGSKELRTRSEIKNLNSFTGMEAAIIAESKRQIEAYESSNLPWQQVLKQGTYRWNPEKNQTERLRDKENSDDYRYFPEPDLVPVVIHPDTVEKIRAALPELPLAKKLRYTEKLGLSDYDANLLIGDRKLAHYFDEGLKITQNAKSLCNWMMVEFQGRFAESSTSLLTSGITASNVATLVNLIDTGKITGKIAKLVADDMVKHPGKLCTDIVAANPDYQPINDTAALSAIVDTILAANQQSIADYHAGKDRAFGFLVGQVMKASKGKANPETVNELLKKALSK